MMMMVVCSVQAKGASCKILDDHGSDSGDELFTDVVRIRCRHVFCLVWFHRGSYLDRITMNNTAINTTESINFGRK